MRLAIVSDTHLPRGSRRLPEACVERLRAADAILHAGDFVALDVLRELEALGPPVHAVHGNVDDAPLRARLHRRFPDAAAVVFGHSHIPLHEADADGFQIFNPGSPTERRRQPRHTMGMATAHEGRLDFELIALD